jgi:Asp-tRNA(Asn)/Glu-tRNA(Gln) amidotransferase A subunit family amidase
MKLNILVGLLCFVVWSGAAEAPKISVQTIQEAENILGLGFTEKEREMMQRPLSNNTGGYGDLRKESFPNELAPAFIFQPWPRGFEVEKETKRPRWKAPKNVKRPKSDEDVAFMTVAELAGLIRTRQITSEELTRFFLERLKRYGDKLHCVVTLTEERAIAEAKRADAELRAGKWRGPLHGIPYAAKDLLDTSGIRTTWGVSLYTNRVPSEDATVIRKLDEAGAVLVAKTSLGELAMGDVWYGGLTRNPWNPEKGSSGSSAGSASAVAAGLVPFAIGSETMGSIVSPATICGVTGLRPTFGRVSRAGAMTLCWSLDKLGPLARSAEDCALVLDAIRGADEADPTTVDAAFRFTDKRSVKKLRVGYVKADFEKKEGNQTNDLVTLEAFRKMGLELKQVEWPKVSQSPLWITLFAEAAAAFDELTRSGDDDKLVQQAQGSWPNSFRSARFIPAVEYIQAMRLRTRLVEEMAKLFSEVDVMVAPSWRGPQMLYSNMAGYPCVVVPNGDKTGGNPASICFVGRLFGEADLVYIAAAYQNATGFHKQRPKLD